MVLGREQEVHRLEAAEGVVKHREEANLSVRGKNEKLLTTVNSV